MKTTRKVVSATKSVITQFLIIIILWGMLGILAATGVFGFATKYEVSIATFVAIPAAVIGIGQLVISSSIQRAGYIKDYALRFRSDKELSESFHYLVYRFGNDLYREYMANISLKQSTKTLDNAQDVVPADLRFFNPQSAIGTPQERRLDNLLGFFDTIGYDLDRNLIQIADIAEIFGFQLDHFEQRDVIRTYIEAVETNWPTMKSFHTKYKAPVPFRFFSQLIRRYVKYREVTSPL